MASVMMKGRSSRVVQCQSLGDDAAGAIRVGLGEFGAGQSRYWPSCGTAAAATTRERRQCQMSSAACRAPAADLDCHWLVGDLCI